MESQVNGKSHATNGHGPIEVFRDNPICEVLCVAPTLVLQFWPHIREYLIAAERNSGRILDERIALIDLTSGAALAWVASQNKKIIGVLMTRLIMAPDGLVCHLAILGAEHMKDWLSGLDGIEKYARAEGCVRLRCQGRIGWERVLRGKFQKTGVILDMRL